MQMLENISPQQRTACLHAITLLNAAGGHARMVGGCVRDGLLGIKAKDVDIEVYGLKAEEVENRLSRDFKLDTVGRAFGVFLLKDHGIDVSLPRRESKTGPKHNDFRVEGDPGMTPDEATQRRDFTINAISYDPLSNTLHDPCGGQQDLENKRLRHISPAFAEDALRVLRGMQFIARYKLQADPETIAICRKLSPLDLPLERIWEEWKKLLLKGHDISGGLNFLKESGWLGYFPELEALVGCPQDPKWHPEGDVWIHTGHCLNAFAANRIGREWEDLIVGLSVLCHDMGKPATTLSDTEGRIRSPRHDIEGVPVTRTFLQRLTRQKSIFEEVLPLVEQHMRPLTLYRDQSGDAAIRRLAARVKRLDRLVRVAYADKCGRPPIPVDTFPEGEWLLRRAKELAVQDNAPKPILLGRHMIQLGAKPGKQFGAILDSCYEAQLEGEFNNVTDGLRFLKKQIDDSHQ